MPPMVPGEALTDVDAGIAGGAKRNRFGMAPCELQADEADEPRAAVDLDRPQAEAAFAKGSPHNKLAKDGRRVARPARREEGAYPSVSDRRATKLGGMNRRPDWLVY